MPRPTKLTITLEAGADAWTAIEALKTEDERDIRLTVEKAILAAIGQRPGYGTDPHYNSMGVFVEEIEVTT